MAGAVSESVRNLVQEVISWQQRRGTHLIPNQHCEDDMEAKLGKRFAKLLLRRGRALGTYPSETQLLPAEVALVNSVSGVPVKGCSVHGSGDSSYTSSCLAKRSAPDKLEAQREAEGKREATPTADFQKFGGEGTRKRMRCKTNANNDCGASAVARGTERIQEEIHGKPAGDASSWSGGLAQRLLLSESSVGRREDMCGEGDGRTSSSAVTAQTLSLRGLNIQWPFSQLILARAKTAEVRTYALDESHQRIARPGEEMWLIETPGPTPNAQANALVEGAAIGPRPSKAQIVGTIAFSHSDQYVDTVAFRADAAHHRIREGGEKDWTDKEERHSWRVAAARSLVKPIPAPANKSMTGFSSRPWIIRVILTQGKAQLFCRPPSQLQRMLQISMVSIVHNNFGCS